MNLTQKISQMTPKGSDLQATDLVEVSTLVGGSYVTKSVTGQDIIDAVASSGVTDVTATAPIVSTGGTTPDISIRQSSSVDDGYLSASDWIVFNDKQDALVSGTNIKTIEGQSLLGSGNINLTATDVGLGNVDNTSDLNKPVSTATQTALNAKQDTLTLTTTGTSGAATLVGGTLNIPQYSGGSANPSVIAASYADGTAVTGTTANTISQSLLIPSNTFTNGMLEVFLRMNKTGTNGTTSVRIYANTSNSLTGATLIGAFGALGTTSIFLHGTRNYRINTNVLTGITTTSATPSDITAATAAQLSTAFNTSVDNYIIFAIQLGSALDTANITMARLIKYA